jgi:hypothetical protein
MQRNTHTLLQVCDTNYLLITQKQDRTVNCSNTISADDGNNQQIYVCWGDIYPEVTESYIYNHRSNKNLAQQSQHTVCAVCRYIGDKYIL